jgi:hypothetical protein
MEVYEIGSEVTIDGEIPARITGISIHGIEHRLQYEVTWWNERSRVSDWLDPFEVKPKSGKTKTLTFVSPAA